MADATPPKKADLAALPDDVLRTHIFQFSALQKENAHLRAEVARLRRIVTRPYYEGAIGLVAQASAEGYSGVDVTDSEAADAYDEGSDDDDDDDVAAPAPAEGMASARLPFRRHRRGAAVRLPSSSEDSG